MIKPRIVVGVDGSAGSAAALRWAAAEARRRGAELRVLTAYHRQLPGQFFSGDRGHAAPDEGAAAVLRAAVTQARSIAPDVDVHAVAVHGFAAPSLLHAAEVAALLVVGARGTRRLPGLPSGSVGAQVATHARCSVVVVRGRPGADTGPVVVGVDDGSAAATVIGRAFEQASLGGAAVLAVTARAGGRPPSSAGSSAAGSSAAGSSAAGSSAVGSSAVGSLAAGSLAAGSLAAGSLAAGPAAGRLASRQSASGSSTSKAVLGTDLADQLDPWREKYPDVPAERDVVAGRPDHVLVDRSRHARLVVVGPRKHGFEGVLLGSVGTRLLQHSDCPVLIARP